MTKPHINRPANQRQHVEDGVGTVDGGGGPRSSAAGLLPSSLIIAIMYVYSRSRVCMCWVWVGRGAWSVDTECDVESLEMHQKRLPNDTNASTR